MLEFLFWFLFFAFIVTMVDDARQEREDLRMQIENDSLNEGSDGNAQEY